MTTLAERLAPRQTRVAERLGAARLLLGRLLEALSGGHWITVHGGEGDEEGGTHLYISNGGGGHGGAAKGTVIAGPKVLIGGNIAHLSDAGHTHTAHPNGHEPAGAKSHPGYHEHQFSTQKHVFGQKGPGVGYDVVVHNPLPELQPHETVSALKVAQGQQAQATAKAAALAGHVQALADAQSTGDTGMALGHALAIAAHHDQTGNIPEMDAHAALAAQLLQVHQAKLAAMQLKTDKKDAYTAAVGAQDHWAAHHAAHDLAQLAAAAGDATEASHYSQQAGLHKFHGETAIALTNHSTAFVDASQAGNKQQAATLAGQIAAHHTILGHPDSAKDWMAKQGDLHQELAQAQALNDLITTYGATDGTDHATLATLAQQIADTHPDPASQQTWQAMVGHHTQAQHAAAGAVLAYGTKEYALHHLQQAQFAGAIHSSQQQTVSNKLQNNEWTPAEALNFLGTVGHAVPVTQAQIDALDPSSLAYAHHHMLKALHAGKLSYGEHLALAKNLTNGAVLPGEVGAILKKEGYNPAGAKAFKMTKGAKNPMGLGANEAGAGVDKTNAKQSRAFTKALQASVNDSAKEQKATIARAMGPKLQAAGITENEAHELQVEMSLVDPGGHADAHERLASGLVKQWSFTAADDHRASLAIQLTAKKIFGHPGWNSQPGHVKNASEWQQALDIVNHPRHGAVLEKAMRAFYDHTQQSFKDAGVTHVTLIRGCNKVMSPGLATAFKDTTSHTSYGVGSMTKRTATYQAAEGEIDTNPLSSWATDHTIAFRNAFLHENVGYHDQHTQGTNSIFVGTIPVEHIYSHVLSGPSCLGEAEMVVIGKDRPYTITADTDKKRWKETVRKMLMDGHTPTTP